MFLGNHDIKLTKAEKLSRNCGTVANRGTVRFELKHRDFLFHTNLL